MECWIPWYIYICLLDWARAADDIFTGDQMVVRSAVTHSTKAHIYVVYKNTKLMHFQSLLPIRDQARRPLPASLVAASVVVGSLILLLMSPSSLNDRIGVWRGLQVWCQAAWFHFTGSGLLYFLEEVSRSRASCVLQTWGCSLAHSLPPSRHFSCLAFSRFWQQKHKLWDPRCSSSSSTDPPIKRGNEEFKPKWVSSRLRGRLRLVYDHILDVYHRWIYGTQQLSQ